MEEIIAERIFEIPARNGDSGAQTLVLQIGKPVRDTDLTGDWFCEFRLTKGEEAGPVMKIYGVDALQALEACLKVASARISGLNNSLDLKWLGTEDLGLPY